MKLVRFLNTLWFRRSTVAVLAYTLALSSISATKESHAKIEIVKPATDNVIAKVEVAPVKLTNSIHIPTVRTITMQVTAYCPCKKCCGPNAHGVTASGKDISYNEGRFVAADTKNLPFGTKLVIPGYHNTQPVEVIDRGGAIKGNKLDVFFATHQEALEWGRQTVEVQVIE